ncbi:MAG: MarR family transcriptional regulator [Myxococcota bacterium]
MTSEFSEVLAETRRLYEAIYRFDQAAAAALGIHSSDLRCVNALEQGPLTAGEIGTRLGLTSGSVTALIRRLTSAGLVERNRSPQDGRQITVCLRPDFYKKADAIYRQLGHQIVAQLEALSPSDLKTVTRGLARMTEGWAHAADLQAEENEG